MEHVVGPRSGLVFSRLLSRQSPAVLSIPWLTMLLSAGLFSRGGALTSPCLPICNDDARRSDIFSTTSGYQLPTAQTDSCRPVALPCFFSQHQKPDFAHISMKQQASSLATSQPAKHPYNHQRPCRGLFIPSMKKQERRADALAAQVEATGSPSPVAQSTKTPTRSLFLPRSKSGSRSTMIPIEAVLTHFDAGEAPADVLFWAANTQHVPQNNQVRRSTTALGCVPCIST
ncbi:hypothetical protein F5X68DRAFT_32228 [Plectosphaerella plurivora]|uniref:Uncharacterized protein n=1 Tax=Plectosphaerella plurivora TaxID=936078 RepID=A0A9P9AF62_9PEZI|nr:hypothetical protein F5X68DRAFT_32228 [Plectosphaerella plurivora]